MNLFNNRFLHRNSFVDGGKFVLAFAEDGGFIQSWNFQPSVDANKYEPSWWTQVPQHFSGVSADQFQIVLCYFDQVYSFFFSNVYVVKVQFKPFVIVLMYRKKSFVSTFFVASMSKTNPWLKS